MPTIKLGYNTRDVELVLNNLIMNMLEEFKSHESLSIVIDVLEIYDEVKLSLNVEFLEVELDYRDILEGIKYILIKEGHKTYSLNKKNSILNRDYILVYSKAISKYIFLQEREKQHFLFSYNTTMDEQQHIITKYTKQIIVDIILAACWLVFALVGLSTYRGKGLAYHSMSTVVVLIGVAILVLLIGCILKTYRYIHYMKNRK